MNVVENLPRICGRPGIMWLRSMIIKLYKQMDGIRIHAEKKCRKIMTPVSDFSPKIQRWYDRTHVYVALCCLKNLDRKYSNPYKTQWFARRRNIENSKNLTEEETKDAVRYYIIR